MKRFTRKEADALLEDLNNAMGRYGNSAIRLRFEWSIGGVGGKVRLGQEGPEEKHPLGGEYRTLTQLCNIMIPIVAMFKFHDVEQNTPGSADIHIWATPSSREMAALFSISRGRQAIVHAAPKDRALYQLGEFMDELSGEADKEYPITDEQGNHGKILYEADSAHAASFAVDALNGAPHFKTVWGEGGSVVLEKSDWEELSDKDIENLKLVCANAIEEAADKA